MTTRTTVAKVTFTQRFKLPGMGGAYPPGVNEIEADYEALDVRSHVAHRRAATRIRLHSPGMMQLLTIDQTDLDAALVDDAWPV